MEVTLALISALWPVFATITGAIVVGVIRMELLGWRVKNLERHKEECDRELYTIRSDIQTINNQIVKELNEIREALAWIKGRFSRAEQLTNTFENHYHEDK